MADSSWITSIGVIGAAALAASTSWIAARRKNTGGVSRTDADTLWAQSQAMRTELQTEVSALRDRVDKLSTDLSSARATIANQQEQITALRVQLTVTQNEAAVLQERINKMTTGSANVASDVRAMKQEINTLTQVGAA